MFAKILHTFTSRLGIAGLSFLVVILTTQYLGAAGRGQVSLLIANITFILLFTNLVGGTGLVYLTPRVNFYQLLAPAYLWSVVTCAAGTFGLFLARQVPAAYVWHLFLLSLLLAFFTANSAVLLGKEHVKTYNYLAFLQALVTFLLVAAGYVVFEAKTVAFYFLALYAAYGATFLLSVIFLLRLPDRPDFSGFQEQLPQLFHLGSTAQVSNIITFLNYRLSFYFLNSWYSLEAVGIFSVGVALAESIWMISRSLAMVQYSRLVNSPDDGEAQLLTTQLAKLSFAATLLTVIMLAILPSEWLTFIFGKEFGQIKPVIWALAPGIVATATGTMFIHYFASRGNYRLNNFSAFYGLLLTVPACWLLIPEFGSVGAGLAATLAYIGMFIFILLKFQRKTGISWQKLGIAKNDIREIKRLLKR